MRKITTALKAAGYTCLSSHLYWRRGDELTVAGHWAYLWPKLDQVELVAAPGGRAKVTFATALKMAKYGEL
jgi:hypothetical protein